MTIYGWDASDFDHDRGMRATHIRRAAEQGIRFFTHKITEGTHVTHQHAGDKLAAARDAGITLSARCTWWTVAQRDTSTAGNLK